MRNKITVATFIIMLIAFSVMLILPPDEDSIKAENRTMSTIPPMTNDTVLSGEFEEGFESFLGDSVAFRSVLTDFSKLLEEKRGFVRKTGKIISTTKDIGTGTTQKQTLLSADNAIMEMFVRNPDAEQSYIDAINYYVQNLPDDIDIYNMLIPTQLEFKEPIYKNLQDSQSDTIQAIYDSLSDRVNTIDVCSYLKNHSEEYIYFRTDHHWTQLGAYYGYRAFMQGEGGDMVNKNDYDTGKITNVLGYLFDRVSKNTPLDPDTIEWYDINFDNHISVAMYAADEGGEWYSYNGVMYELSKSDYNFFFGSDHPIVVMDNSNNIDGKTIVVFKDSYTNVLAPWLAESYKTVVLVDPRIYTGTFETVLENYSPDEVLFVNYIFTTNFSDYCDMMKKVYE